MNTGPGPGRMAPMSGRLRFGLDDATRRRIAALRTCTVAVLVLVLATTGCGDGIVEAVPPAGAPLQSAAAFVHAADRNALVALYNATGGPEWTHNDNWLTDEPLDEWYGVVVDDAGRVTGLHLPRNGLQGELPAALGDLDGLRSLHLHANELTGSIPPDLVWLQRLGALVLSDNDLSGPLPEELAELDSLVGLWVGDNSLEGVVPAGFLELQPLFFDIGGNENLCLPGTAEFAAWAERLLFFAGSVCGKDDLEVLRALYEATDGANWTDADGWLEGDDASGWHGVETDSVGRVSGLELRANGLAGTLPEELGRLKGLTKLDVSANELTGVLPEALGSVESLTVLDVSANGLSGRLPQELGDLAKLVRLDLSGNYFSGPLPIPLRYTALEELRYESTRLCIPDDPGFRLWLRTLATHEGTGEHCAGLSERQILEAIYEATNGDGWYNSHNWLTNAPLGGWQGVETDAEGHVIGLYLRRNFLNGKIPREIGGLVHLESLDLSENYFLEPPIPEELFDLTELRVLKFEDTSMSGPLPPAIGRLAKLEDLDWGWSGLTGPIPPELAELTELRFLRLGGNAMVGAIPPELGDLTKLGSLNLQSNRLTGPVPTELARLSRLAWLSVSRNSLSGAIPAELGNLTDLFYLDLARNDLTGSIPPELGELAELNALYLNGNSLEGLIPETFSNLTKLESLRVGGNPELSGAVPASLSGLRNLGSFMAGATGLCAPDDAEFLAWLRGISETRLALCEPAPAYLTQAVQSQDFPVSLVAGQPALLRVFVASEHAVGEMMPEVRATIYVNDVEVHNAVIPGGQAAIPTAVDEGSLASSANADIPGEVIRPGLEMVIEVDPNGTLDPGLGIPARIPETGRTAVAVIDVPDFELTLVPFLWAQNPDSAILDITAEMASDPRGHPMLFETRSLLPINRMDVHQHDPVVSSSNSGFDHLDEVSLMRNLENGSGYWMGMRTPVTLGLLGVAWVGGWTSWSLPLSPTIAHELGHNLSLRHANCGGPSGVDPSFPDASGVIGSWGYDREAERTVSPWSPDIQSYCGGQWIGEYHHTRSIKHRVQKEGSAARGASTRSVLVWGGLDARGDPFLNPSFIADVVPSQPLAGNGHVVRGRTEDGTEAFSIRFDMPRMMDAEGERGGFVFAVPVTWEGDLESITLAGRGKSFTLDEDTDQPMTILRDPVTGQVRAILRTSAEQATATLGEPGLAVMFSRGIPR
ncbi:MAG: hypothetical protein F4022_06275 [Gemmatimonadetes bacterium]|nr:hypothetical protein [Gemmatimonadota bacterium]